MNIGLGSYSSNYYDDSPFKCWALQFCKKVPTFQMNVLPPSQSLAAHTDKILGVPAPEDGGSMLLQNLPSQHGITSPMTWLFTNTAVRMSYLTYWCQSSKLLGITSLKMVISMKT
jgi:hypothetical protein